jgi:ADP-ribose pyrophosphatase
MPIVFRSRVFSVHVDRVRLPNGRERDITVVRHPPSVVLIPYEGDGRIVLVRQFRASIGQTLWELPAGTVEPGESAEAAAERECEEEIGRVPGRMVRLRGLFPAPGFCDEELIYFRLFDLKAPAADSSRRPDEDEDILARPFTLAEARGMADRGEIVDLKSAYGLTLA